MTDLERARELAHAALASLERSRRRIDDLNVYPVPDGDTGTNMTLTARAVVEQLDRTATDERAALMSEISRAALLGARGNSGVILSQIVRGVCEALAQDENVATALRSASDAAYRAVREPVEGTMLSVIRELAEEAEANGANFAALVRRGEEAVSRTQQTLDVLRSAGVVDAGGAGLLELVRGVAAVVVGEPLPELPVERAELGVEAIHQELSRYRYCTTFLIEGDDLDPDEIGRRLETFGDSLLVVGGKDALKVHVHTDEPGRALEVGANVGLTAEQAAELAAKPVTVVPTASIQAGLAAMVSYLPERSAADNAAEMADVLESLVTGEVTIASRDVQLDGVDVKEGAWLGLADGAAVAGGPAFDDVAEKVADSLLAEPRMVLTLLTGTDAPDLEPLLAHIRERYPDLELDVQPGGQPHYPLLLSAE